jgi:heme O synthase-like polyprenyltransferase
MLTTLLILTALLALALAGRAAARVHHLEHALRGQGLEIGALCARVGVTDQDVDAYHARIHPQHG